MRDILSNTKGNPGFTIIDLVIVIALLAILSSIAVPGINELLPKYRLKSAAADIASNLNCTRLQAISTNREHRIIFDTVNNSYQRSSGDKANGSGAWQAEGDWISTGSISIYSVTSLTNATVLFRPNGSVQSIQGDAGDIFVSNSKGQKQRVRIISATGNISVQPECEW